VRPAELAVKARPLLPSSVRPKSNPRPERHVAEQWVVGVRWFHRTCAAFIGLAVAFIALSKWTGFLASHSVLIGEVVAVLAFGVSWLAKGWERPVLLPQTPPRCPAGPEEERTMATPV
jgi:hypothetical protein